MQRQYPTSLRAGGERSGRQQGRWGPPPGLFQRVPLPHESFLLMASSPSHWPTSNAIAFGVRIAQTDLGGHMQVVEDGSGICLVHDVNFLKNVPTSKKIVHQDLDAQLFSGPGPAVSTVVCLQRHGPPPGPATPRSRPP